MGERARTVTKSDDYEAWLLGRIHGMLRLSREYAVKERYGGAAELDVKRRVLIEALDEYRKFRGGEETRE